ncbi:MAG TPA: flagellar hook capping FlgD N-terminal domain-containing protein [Acidimicrobiales bacterium]|jgi:flagellar basal-body rod modification protein FlgD|nr:flagellar hook capping FlgD N-terminal domain-containing protein [Acidimicrobiales bacterium]
MSYVDGTSATGTSNAAAAAASSQTSTGLNQLDNSQTFLNLLVAQLKNQNPDNPTDPTSFMTEIAQLTAVQSQTTLSADEETVAADSMLNQTVSGTGTNGKVTGTVTGVLLGDSGTPQLVLGNNEGTLTLSAVSAVYGAGATTGTTTTSTSK